MNNSVILTVTFIFLILSTFLSAQEEEPRYILGDAGSVKVSGFGAYILGFSEFDGSLAVYNGGGGAVLLNQTVYFGGYGAGLSTRHNRGSLTLQDPKGELVTYENLYTDFGHGGFWIGYIHKSYKPVHFGASTKLGWGSLSMSNDVFDKNFDEYDYYHIVQDNVFVINPQLEVELNLLRWFKINASAGYQFVTGVDKTYKTADGRREQFFSDNEFNKPVFNLAFVFGGFGGKRN